MPDKEDSFSQMRRVSVAEAWQRSPVFFMAMMALLFGWAMISARMVMQLCGWL